MIEFVALAAACAPGVHVSTMAAVVQQESGGNPWAIGVNRAAALREQPRSQSEAIATARRLVAAGHDIDVGLAQINIRNFRWLGLTLETAFDPCTNLKAAERVLADCYVRATKRHAAGQQALYAALSCYNTGSFERGITNGYVRKVAQRAGVKVPALSTNLRNQSVPTPRPGDNEPASEPEPATDAFGRHRADDPTDADDGDIFASPAASELA